MKKRTISMILAMAMTAACLAGCGSKTQSTADSADQAAAGVKEADAENAEADAAAEQSGEAQEIPVDAYAGTTITVAVNKAALDKGESFNDKPIFQMAEEATGIHVEFIEIEEANNGDKMNIILASGDLPDAFLGVLNENQMASNIDSFYDLSEEGLLETYAPNVVADYEEMNGLAALTWPDGSVRSLMTGPQISYNNAADGIMVINQAWLDQLGLELPETADEFYEVLKAFKENDMNGNGIADEIPLEFSSSNWAAQIMNLANPWGIAGQSSSNLDHYLMVKDGQVTGTLYTEEFRAFLEYYHKLADEGLIDMEGFGQTSEQYYAKLKGNQVGCYIAWSPYSNFDVETARDWVVLKPFTAMDGVEPKKTGNKERLFATRTGFAIAADSENVEAVLTWWNYMSSSLELKWTARAGEQGNAWDIVDGQVVSRTPEGLSDGFTETDYQYTYACVDRAPFLRADEIMIAEEMEDDATWERQCMVDVVYDMIPDEVVPSAFVDPEENTAHSLIQTELATMADNFVATSISEGVTDESWEAFQESLVGLQYDEWLAYYQRILDAQK